MSPDATEPERPPIEPKRPKYPSLPDWVGPGTRLIHGARPPDLNAGSIVPPIYQTSTFRFPPELSEAESAGRVHLYTRYTNPTVEVAAEMIRGLEGGQEARLFGSGMGAMTTALLSLVHGGDEIVALDTLYGGTLGLLTRLLPGLDVRVRWVDGAHAAAPEEVVGEGTRVAVIETPTNPTLTVHDLRRWANACDAAGAFLLVDNTFATPINQRPLAHGADLVMHSGTKYLGGHADVSAGALVVPEGLVETVDATHRLVGAVADPFAAFLLARGMKTLPLRVARQNESGRRLALEVADHPAVERVRYPGNASADQEAIATRQMSGRGGVVTVQLRGGRAAAKSFLQELRLIHPAASFGGVESLASLPSETSHRGLTDAALAERGVGPGAVRLSLGVEETDDLIRDVRDALDALDRGRSPAPPTGAL